MNLGECARRKFLCRKRTFFVYFFNVCFVFYKRVITFAYRTEFFNRRLGNALFKVAVAFAVKFRFNIAYLFFSDCGINIYKVVNSVVSLAHFYKIVRVGHGALDFTHNRVGSIEN